MSGIRSPPREQYGNPCLVAAATGLQSMESLGTGDTNSRMALVMS